MKFACHKARALSRVAITILVGVDELGIIITIGNFGNAADVHFSMPGVRPDRSAQSIRSDLLLIRG
jgi:hypothetical protein